MAEQEDSHRATRILIIVAALAIITGGIREAQSVLEWFLVAVFLAAIGTPSVLWLEQKGIPYVVAVFFAVAGMATVIVFIGLLVGASLNSFYNDLPFYQARLQTHVSSLQAFLASKGITFTDSFLVDQVKPEAVKSLTASLLRGLGSALFEIALILLTVTFIFLEASSFPVKLRAILGDPQKDFHPFMRFVYDINRYMVIKTAISLTVGALIGIWLSVLGVDFAILWGFLAFLLHYVPNIGALISAVPAVFLALIQLGIGRAALAAAGYITVDFVLGNVIEPRLMGRRLGLSTLVVILSLFFWGGLLNLIGVVLCIPLTMTVKFACENNKSTRWIAVLLGPEMTPAQVSPASKKGTDKAA
ncbi:MAG TPA: AI-2E family transporter [Nitrospirota bacterium]|nr:AI-2E family transporter [Nitrospirota bacterium]